MSNSIQAVNQISNAIKEINQLSNSIKNLGIDNKIQNIVNTNLLNLSNINLSNITQNNMGEFATMLIQGFQNTKKALKKHEKLSLLSFTGEVDAIDVATASVEAKALFDMLIAIENKMQEALKTILSINF